MGAGLKVILLSNHTIGKTSILDYAITNVHVSTNLLPTVAGSSSVLTVEFSLGPVHLRVEGTAEQELFRSIVPIYVRNAGAALLV
jgi:hypothetical protein